jgi:hypothetical protein
VSDQEDIIEQGQGRPSPHLAMLRIAVPRIAAPRRLPVITVAGAAAAVLIASSVVAIARPWAEGPGLADPCRLLPAATVASLLPAGSIQGPSLFGTTTTTTGVCTWQSGSGTLLSVDVEYSVSNSLAQREFSALPDPVGSAVAGTIRTLPGIGDQAQAILETGFPDEAAVYLRVRSGSTIFGIGMDAPRLSSSPLPSDNAVLAKLIPASRTALSRLATTPRPAATPITVAAVPAAAPSYALPANACSLLTRGDLPSYLGSDPQRFPVGGPAGGCAWTGDADQSLLIVSVYVERPGYGFSGTARAQLVYEAQLATASTAYGEGTAGGPPRRIQGLGTQAVAVFSGFPDIVLYTWAGNALINIEFADPLGSPPSLSVAIAATHAVLAALPRA